MTTNNELEQLQQVLDACEQSNLVHLSQIQMLEDGNMRQANLIGEQNVRIEKLEELCRDMYERIQVRDKDVSETFGWSKQAYLFSDNMKELGLLKGENNG